MARDVADLMTQLGHDTFALAAHDRGARVAHRLALDLPQRVTKLAVLDIVPTIEHFERADMAFALAYYDWFWFAQPHPFPEDMIDRAPDTWFSAHTGGVAGIPPFFAPEALEDYLRAVHDPAAITGMCEDYRAAATIDLVHDRMSRAEGRQVQCPMLVLWGEKGKVGGWYDPVAIWREYCKRRGHRHRYRKWPFPGRRSPGRSYQAVRGVLLGVFIARIDGLSAPSPGCKSRSRRPALRYLWRLPPCRTLG